MKKHSPEPWRLRLHIDGTAMPQDAKGRNIFFRALMSCEDGCNDADGRRIVACINACKRIPTRWIETHKKDLNAILIRELEATSE